MAVLTASQNWKKQSSEKLPTTSEMQSPRIRSFVPLQNLVQPHPLLPSLGKRKVSPQEVIAALSQVDKEPKSASTQGLQRASSKEQASKDQSSKVDDEAFSVAQFLVGFSEVEGEGASQDDGGVALQSHSLPSPMSLEAFLGISTTVPSPPPPHFAKAVRNLAEILVENRFRYVYQTVASQLVQKQLRTALVIDSGNLSSGLPLPFMSVSKIRVFFYAQRSSDIYAMVLGIQVCNKDWLGWICT